MARVDAHLSAANLILKPKHALVFHGAFVLKIETQTRMRFVFYFMKELCQGRAVKSKLSARIVCIPELSLNTNGVCV